MKKRMTVWLVLGCLSTPLLSAHAQDSLTLLGRRHESTPQLILTGVVALSANKWAMISEVMPDGTVRPWTLREAGRGGDLEVLAIEVPKQTVAIRYRGQKRELRFGVSANTGEERLRPDVD